MIDFLKYLKINGLLFVTKYLKKLHIVMYSVNLKFMLVHSQHNIKIILLGLCLFHVQLVSAQLGICKGTLGPPIFMEDFGSGNGNVKLAKGRTTYSFTRNRPRDGSYAISNKHKHFNWFKLNDHTPNDENGRMLIVNASFEPGEFFRLPISGLCKSTFYEFSSWIVNLTRTYTEACGKGIPINVSYQIWNKTNEKLLASGNTGPIYGGSEPTWRRFALMFTTRPNETSVILKIRNNGKGGCGNDLALDDITLRPCGDIVNVVDKNNKSRVAVNDTDTPFTTTLIAKPKFEAFPFYFYQWQQSKNGVNWKDIPRANKATYKIPSISSKVYYRTKVSNKVQDLNFASCYYYSENYEVNVLKSKPGVTKRPVVKGVTNLVPETTNATVPIKKQDLDKANLPKTHKQVIIVKHGNKVIFDKVWFDGVIGKFVQTGEKILSKGHPKGSTVVHETVYTKTIYGYNSFRRVYIKE